jgi:hypothetical protein
MTHTAKYMNPAIGQTVLIRVEGWTIPVTVRDVKSAWGKIRLQVEPVMGTGLQWVEMDRVAYSQERAMVTA